MKTKLILLTPGLLLAACYAAFAQPVIITQPTNTTTSLAGNVQFRVWATSTNPPITYQWWFKEVALDPVANPSAAKNLLSLTNVTLADAGPYFVVVNDASSLATTSQVAILTMDPTFTKITTGPGEPITYGSVFMLWWDYDTDGFMDLFAGTYGSGPTNRLYHNNLDGTFTRIANAISTTWWSSDLCAEGAVADYDNDGDEDLFVANAFGGRNLYRNDGAGAFTRLTKEQVGPALGDAEDTMNAVWVDYDCDGFIDLFRANSHLAPQNDCLYRNNGNGTFSKMTANEVGQLVSDRADAVRSPWADYDNDGWPDVWQMTETSATNVLYHNDRGFFRKVTTGSIAEQREAFGAVWGDYDNDGFLDLFATGFVWGSINRPHALHRNLGGLTFTNVAASAGIPSTHRGTGASWADYDNDGFLDLYVTADTPYPSLLLRNNGDGTFSSVDVGSPIHDSTAFARVGIGWVDYDNDGFLDLAVACPGSPNLLFRNNGNQHHWLKVKLIGTASNRSAIGAKVRVQASIRTKERAWQMREISGNSSFCGGSGALLAHFGLGDATNVDVLRIEWPSGLVQEVQNVAANQSLTLTEHQEGVTEVPNLTATRPVGGPIQLTLTGQTNLLYVLEASTNLMTWTKTGVRTNLTGSVDFADTLATNYSQRFYRAVAP